MGKKLGDTKGTYDKQPKWEDEVEWVDFRDGKDHIVRLVGDFSLMARQWVVTKKGKFFPVWSPKYNPETETMDLDNPDPMYDDFNKFPQVMLISNVIDRNLQEKGRNPNPVRGAMIPAASVIPTLKQIMNLIKAEPADPKKGIDLSITFNPKGAGQQKWSIINGGTTPLAPHEDPNSDECEYEYYNFDKICPNFATDEEAVNQYYRTMKEGMGRNFYYVKKIGKVDKNNPWEAFKSDINGQPYTDFAELEGFPKPGEKGGSDPSRKRRASSDEEDEEMPPTRKSQAAKKRPKPPVEDDDDEQEESEGSEQIHPDIPNREDPEHGTVPECFTQYDGTKKCKKCPVRMDCLKSLPEEDEDDL